MTAYILAMQEEAKYFLRDIGGDGFPSPLFETVRRAQVNGTQVFVLVCGIGKANAAAAAAFAISDLRADLIVNIGTAGGIEQRCKPGDFILASDVRFFDCDVRAFGYQPGQVPREPVSHPANEALLAEASDIVRSIPGFNGSGAVATGDVFVTQATIAAYPGLAGKPTYAVDMEAAAIAQLCAKSRTPFVAVKVIADNVLAPAGEEQFSKTLDKCARKIKDIGLALARPAWTSCP